VTQQDADRIKQWLDGLTIRQFGLLWRWITRLYFLRLHEARGERAER